MDKLQKSPQLRLQPRKEHGQPLRRIVGSGYGKPENKAKEQNHDGKAIFPGGDGFIQSSVKRMGIICFFCYALLVNKFCILKIVMISFRISAQFTGLLLARGGSFRFKGLECSQKAVQSLFRTGSHAYYRDL